MSYKPTIWHSGDIITPHRLNKIEQGIANNNANKILTITVSEFRYNGNPTQHLDQSYNTIKNAILNNYEIIIIHNAWRDIQNNILDYSEILYNIKLTESMTDFGKEYIINFPDDYFNIHLEFYNYDPNYAPPSIDEIFAQNNNNNEFL